MSRGQWRAGDRGVFADQRVEKQPQPIIAAEQAIGPRAFIDHEERWLTDAGGFLAIDDFVRDEHDVRFGVALLLEPTLSEVLAFPNCAIPAFF